jgi:toxin ParE1/3/4
MMQVVIHNHVREEILQAADWYEQQSTGLSQKLLKEFKDVLDDIKAFPEMGTLVEEGIRRRVLKYYPYSIIYRLLPDKLLIVGFMHHKRSLYTWRYRQ